MIENEITASSLSHYTSEKQFFCYCFLIGQIILGHIFEQLQEKKIDKTAAGTSHGSLWVFKYVPSTGWNLPFR